jgi:hypothetical protein
MTESSLTVEEFAALAALDSSIGQRCPSLEMQIRLRLLGLIERDDPSLLPARTAKGEALVRLGRPASNDDQR